MKNGTVNSAIEAIKNGGVVLMPTDTVCGLFAAPSASAAVARIYKMKKRPADKPLAILIPDKETALDMISDPVLAKSYIDRYWPGAVTFIFSKGSGDTVAMRMPDCPPLLEVLAKTGPLAATSANISGRPAPRDIEKVDPEITGICDAVYDFEFTPSGQPSRIIDLSSGKPETLR
jgi:L-threonylcarbamoyladenylate synthase